jgi:hypothetical protein
LDFHKYPDVFRGRPTISHKYPYNKIPVNEITPELDEIVHVHILGHRYVDLPRLVLLISFFIFVKNNYFEEVPETCTFKYWRE